MLKNEVGCITLKAVELPVFAFATLIPVVAELVFSVVELLLSAIVRLLEEGAALATATIPCT